MLGNDSVNKADFLGFVQVQIWRKITLSLKGFCIGPINDDGDLVDCDCDGKEVTASASAIESVKVDGNAFREDQELEAVFLPVPVKLNSLLYLLARVTAEAKCLPCRFALEQEDEFIEVFFKQPPFNPFRPFSSIFKIE